MSTRTGSRWITDGQSVRYSSLYKPIRSMGIGSQPEHGPVLAKAEVLLDRVHEAGIIVRGQIVAEFDAVQVLVHAEGAEPALAAVDEHAASGSLAVAARRAPVHHVLDRHPTFVGPACQLHRLRVGEQLRCGGQALRAIAQRIKPRDSQRLEIRLEHVTAC